VYVHTKRRGWITLLIMAVFTCIINSSLSHHEEEVDNDNNHK